MMFPLTLIPLYACFVVSTVYGQDGTEASQNSLLSSSPAFGFQSLPASIFEIDLSSQKIPSADSRAGLRVDSPFNVGNDLPPSQANPTDPTSFFAREIIVPMTAMENSIISDSNVLIPNTFVESDIPTESSIQNVENNVLISAGSQPRNKNLNSAEQNKKDTSVNLAITELLPPPLPPTDKQLLPVNNLNEGPIIIPMVSDTASENADLPLSLEPIISEVPNIEPISLPFSPSSAQTTALGENVKSVLNTDTVEMQTTGTDLLNNIMGTSGALPKSLMDSKAVSIQHQTNLQNAMTVDAFDNNLVQTNTLDLQNNNLVPHAKQDIIVRKPPPINVPSILLQKSTPDQSINNIIDSESSHSNDPIGLNFNNPKSPWEQWLQNSILQKTAKAITNEHPLDLTVQKALEKTIEHIKQIKTHPIIDSANTTSINNLKTNSAGIINQKAKSKNSQTETEKLATATNHQIQKNKIMLAGTPVLAAGVSSPVQKTKITPSDTENKELPSLQSTLTNALSNNPNGFISSGNLQDLNIQKAIDASDNDKFSLNRRIVLPDASFADAMKIIQETNFGNTNGTPPNQPIKIASGNQFVIDELRPVGQNDQPSSNNQSYFVFRRFVVKGNDMNNFFPSLEKAISTPDSLPSNSQFIVGPNSVNGPSQTVSKVPNVILSAFETRKNDISVKPIKDFKLSDVIMGNNLRGRSQSASKLPRTTNLQSSNAIGNSNIGNSVLDDILRNRKPGLIKSFETSSQSNSVITSNNDRLENIFPDKEIGKKRSITSLENSQSVRSSIQSNNFANFDQTQPANVIRLSNKQLNSIKSGSDLSILQLPRDSQNQQIGSVILANTDGRILSSSINDKVLEANQKFSPSSNTQINRSPANRVQLSVEQSPNTPNERTPLLQGIENVLANIPENQLTVINLDGNFGIASVDRISSVDDLNLLPKATSSNEFVSESSIRQSPDSHGNDILIASRQNRRIAAIHDPSPQFDTLPKDIHNQNIGSIVIADPDGHVLSKEARTKQRDRGPLGPLSVEQSNRISAFADGETSQNGWPFERHGSTSSDFQIGSNSERPERRGFGTRNANHVQPLPTIAETRLRQIQSESERLRSAGTGSIRQSSSRTENNLRRNRNQHLLLPGRRQWENSIENRPHFVSSRPSRRRESPSSDFNDNRLAQRLNERTSRNDRPRGRRRQREQQTFRDRGNSRNVKNRPTPSFRTLHSSNSRQRENTLSRDSRNRDGGRNRQSDVAKRDGGRNRQSDVPNRDGGRNRQSDVPNRIGGRNRQSDVPNRDGARNRQSDVPNRDGGRNRQSDVPNRDGGRNRQSDVPNRVGGRNRQSDVPNRDGGRNRQSDVPNRDGGRNRQSDVPNRGVGRNRQSDVPRRSSNQSASNRHESFAPREGGFTETMRRILLERNHRFHIGS